MLLMDDMAPAVIDRWWRVPPGDPIGPEKLVMK
jgi:hypothetical protein